MTFLRLPVHMLASLYALFAAVFIFAKYAVNTKRPVYLRPTLKDYRVDLAHFFAAACVVAATWGGQ